MDTKIFSTNDLIKKIVDYQNINKILKEKSHHFVFDCPLDKSFVTKPEFIWIGVNPGDDTGDWDKTEGKNSQETRAYDFQENVGRSRNSHRRIQNIKAFLGPEIFKKTTHTELFFWGSRNTKKDFVTRYGTKFLENPHLEFCLNLNRELINRISPKAIFFEKKDNLKILKEFFNLEFSKLYDIPDYPVEEYILNGKTRLFNFHHLSALGKHITARPEAGTLIRSLLK